MFARYRVARAEVEKKGGSPGYNIRNETIALRATMTSLLWRKAWPHVEIHGSERASPRAPRGAASRAPSPPKSSRHHHHHHINTTSLQSSRKAKKAIPMGAYLRAMYPSHFALLVGVVELIGD
jgi:hypothetical protein